MVLTHYPRGGGNGDCSSANRGGVVMGNVLRLWGQEQQWLSGPVAGAAAAVTMRMARQVEGLGIRD